MCGHSASAWHLREQCEQIEEHNQRDSTDAQSEEEVRVRLPKLPSDKKCLITFETITSKAAGLLPEGSVIACDQIKLSDAKRLATPRLARGVKATETETAIALECRDASLVFDKALELQEKAQNELDDAKYMALVQDFEVTLKKCIEPFEQAYVVCEDAAIKSTIAEYLKQIYYRFRDQDPKFQAGYEKYNALLNN